MAKGTALLTLAVAAVFIGGQAPAKRREDPCSTTSKAAHKACKSEALDDYWIAVGICSNLAADDVRAPCLGEAKASFKETSKDALGGGRYDPVIEPRNFLSPAATAANPNPYLPLVPGTSRVYKGAGELVTVTVTDQTKSVLGVTATVVRDVVVTDPGGALIEDTFDYFAQDVDGNVWYLGELSQGFEDGQLASLEGSWRAGVEGAKPGIVMQAMPTVGDPYRQEFDLGNAEDAAEVISTTASESVPGASCNGDCVVTRDFTPIEPDVEENKYYARGVGMILEIDLDDGARLELISVSAP